MDPQRPPTRTLIVTTGDCSDYDGFTAIPLYKAALAKSGGGTLMFIMNYPSFLREPSKAIDKVNELPPWQASFGTPPMFAADKIGWGHSDAARIHAFERDACGYTYNADEFYAYRDGKHVAAGEPSIDFQINAQANATNSQANATNSQANAINSHANAMADDKFPEGLNKTSTTAVRAFKLLTVYAMALARSVWDNAPNYKGVDIQFTIGGINTFNGFSIGVYKNEIAVYRDIVTTILGNTTLDMTALTYAMTWMQHERASYTDIFMDMNGSMAWYPTLHSTNPVPAWVPKLRGVYIMGGMPPPADLFYNKVSASPPFMSRQISCTFNQLYAPSQTANFMGHLTQFNIPIVIVSNATCNLSANFNDIFKLQNLEPYADAKKMCTGALTHLGVLAEIDAAAYTKFLTVPGAQPIVFDLVCATKLAVDVVTQTTLKVDATLSYLCRDTTTHNANKPARTTSIMEHFVIHAAPSPINPDALPAGSVIVPVTNYMFAPATATALEHYTKMCAAIKSVMANQAGGGGRTRTFKKTSERAIVGTHARVVYSCKRAKYVIVKGAYVTVKAAQKAAAAAKKTKK
jgi:hypothetical protein